MKYIKSVVEFKAVRVAEYVKAIAKMKKVRSIIPNWSKECGGVGEQRYQVGIDRYQMFL